jgi:hypothetical protein
LYKKLLLTLFVFLAGVSYIASADATPKSSFGKNIFYDPSPDQTTLGDRWNMLNTALKEAENTNYHWAQKSLDQAHQIYLDYFKEAALEVDPESDQIIESAFSYNTDYIKEKELVEAGFNRQAIDKSIYKIAYMKLENALDDGDADSFLKWYAVMETKFAISKNPDLVTNQAILEIKENPDKIHYHKDTIKSELIHIFKTKVVEEIEEAIAAIDQGKTNDAIKFTYEGYYYYRTLHPYLIDQLGQEEANKIKSNMKSAMDITRSGAPNYTIKTKLEQILKNVEPGVKGHQDQSETGLALNSIKDRLHLVEEEYRDAVIDGKITNQVEYDETVVFLAKAGSILGQNKADLVKIDENAISKIESNLQQIDEIVASYGPFDELESLVEDSVKIIDDMIEKSGATENSSEPNYFANIKQLLEQSKTEYASGNTQAALDLGQEAYLDNYEFLEAPIAEYDKELMEKIEIMMRIELVNLIKGNSDKSEINDHIGMILKKLDHAQSLVSQVSVADNKPLLSPLEQLESGIEPENVACSDDKVLVIKKSSDTSACVKPHTLSRLVTMGWGTAP